ncbi:hypothetical protein [Arsenophonus endosymbiont of Aleurodicus floccissimus]|uniref:hypothetical protein n=1 Tax=Arsenophonus endosymbiont of Aleurodicus floccissimus TaxID=2152761 RepID=UPI001EDE085B|nr:hypothetical protein [Arsenophonus endosymbiont of Aleurodicus floccissimus]
MKDVRPLDHQLTHYQDLTPSDAQQAWFYSIKDYILKNIILPALLNPNILIHNQQVINFFTPNVAKDLYNRINEIKNETSIIDFKPIHSYKTPAFRLYFEFKDKRFNSLRHHVDEDIGYPPPLPACFNAINNKDFNRFIYYFL